MSNGNAVTGVTAPAGPGPSVLDDLGAEITGVAFPVSVCMTLTIALVRLLHRDDDDDRSTVIIAEAFYGEQVCSRSWCMSLASVSGVESRSE